MTVAPTRPPGTDTEVLIKEARMHQHRRWRWRSIGVLVILGVVVGLVFALGGGSNSSTRALRPGAPAPGAPSASTTTTVVPVAPSNPGLMDLALFSPTNGYALFESNGNPTCSVSVGHTADAGAQFSPPVTVASWNCHQGSGIGPVDALAFDDHGDGFAYGPGLIVSHDAGQTWAPVPHAGTVLSVAALGSSVWMVESECPAGAALEASVCHLLVMESGDGGRTWARSPSQPGGTVIPPQEQASASLIRLSPSAAYVMGNPASPSQVISGGSTTFGPADETLWYTADGGATWSPRTQPCAMGASTTELWVAPDGTLWAACATEGGAGEQMKTVSVSTDGGTTWSLRSNGTVDVAASQPLDSGYLGGIAAVSATRAYLIGGRMSLLVTDDGGVTWQVVSSVDSGESAGGTYQVIFFNPAQGVVFGNDLNDNLGYALWSTSDGGLTWAAVVPKIG